MFNINKLIIKRVDLKSTKSKEITYGPTIKEKLYLLRIWA